MLKKRIIPMLLLKEGRMVKGKRFANFRDVGNPVTAARVYNSQKVDELIFLDIEPSTSSRESVKQIIRSVGEECFMPLTVGGGVRTLEDFHELLQLGADKVSLNTAAVKTPSLVREGARRFGDQCVVVSVDYKRDPSGKRKVVIESGKKTLDLDPLDHILRCVELGAGEILLTSIDHEGEMEGYDFPFLQQVASRVPVPVIASGGAGKLEHFEKALVECDCSAVGAGSIFHFTDQSPIKVRYYLTVQNLPVRVK
ncbi:MAG TPA: imidazole glycerol phosphate synthase cyclase subunit [Thermotogota bacterium]|nr:imidazole glycerol phosphate synthase cyclase subunit [Thermotogota bacterium]